MSIPPRTIRRESVFISAVTRELGTVRDLVKKALEDSDYHPVEQKNFPADYRDLKDKLRERIGSCEAVVHIAGHCYGAEPPEKPADAPRRSYTQLEYDIAVELKKPVYAFLTGAGFPADRHDPEPAEFQELQEAHRNRLASTGQDYNPVATREELDQKIRGLRLKVERLTTELQQVDQKVEVHGGRLRRGLVAVAVLVVAVLGVVGYLGWRQQAEHRAQEQERARQGQERIAAEAARREAQTIEQVQQDFAERFLQQLVTNKEITAEDARQRALKELPALVKLPLAEIESLIDRKIAPRATAKSLSSLDRARAALAKGNYDEVFQAADEQKKQGRELAMLEGTAALARFRQSPKPEWNARALAAFQRAMALTDPNSPTEWQAWTDAAASAALVLYDLARYSEAEPLLRVCLQLREANTGPNSPGVVVVLNNLAELLRVTNRLVEAEPLYRRATLAISELSHGRDHPDVATDLNNLAELLRVTNRLAEAEPLYRRALTIDERSQGSEHPDVAIVLNNLAELLRATNRQAEAEPLFRRALTIFERSHGPDHPYVATLLNNVAHLLYATNRLAEAEPLFRRSLSINERSYGPEHPIVAIELNNLAEMLKSTNRLAEAEPLCRRALAIDELSHVPDHPDVAIRLNNLAQLLKSTNRITEAEALMRRVLTIDESSYGADHPDIAVDLNNLADLLRATNRMAEAEPLYRRALAIDEQSYGPDHPDVATVLNNLTQLLEATNRLAEAEPLMARAVGVFSRFQRSTGHEHPFMRLAMTNYRRLLSMQKLPAPELAARIKAALQRKENLSPIVPEVERLLGPAKPVADVLTSLDLQYKEQGKPAAYFLRVSEPIVPHLDELLRPTGDRLNVQGVLAFRGGAYASAVVLYEAALVLLANQPAKAPMKLIARMNRASALRELGLVAQAQDELVKLQPELDYVPTTDAAMKGRARYHLALCQWRLGDRAAAQKSAEESLAAYDGVPKSNPVNLALRRQSEDLLKTVKVGKAPPPLAAIDAPAALEAARARYRAREALTKLPLKEKAAPLLDQVLGPARSTQEVFTTLDRYYREQCKPAVWFLPLKERIAPHLDQLLGPGRTVKDVLDSLDQQYRAQGKPPVWFLPLSEPISPHLDELLVKVSK